MSKIQLPNYRVEYFERLKCEDKIKRQFKITAVLEMEKSLKRGKVLQVLNIEYLDNSYKVLDSELSNEIGKTKNIKSCYNVKML